MDEQSAFEQMAAALNDHQITGDDGEIIAGQTATEEPAAQETSTDEEIAQESDLAQSSTQEDGDEDEIPAVDDSGKRYVPEKRLKKETAKRREAERLAKQKADEAEALKALVGQTMPVRQQEQLDSKPSNPDVDRLELRMVFRDYPQFNPNSGEYSRELDKIAGNLRRANPGMSVMEAAEEAVNIAKNITSDQLRIAQEARTVKAQQSDQGITSRVLNRSAQTADPERMTLEEKEQWLKDNGQW